MVVLLGILELSSQVVLILVFASLGVAVYLYGKIQFDGAEVGDARHKPREMPTTHHPYGVAYAMGKRAYMEDRYLCTKMGDSDSSLYCVFDGHNGSRCAEFCVEHFWNYLNSALTTTDDIGKALSKGVVDMDDSFFSFSETCYPRMDDGSTLVAAVVKGNDVWVANVGDSRAIVVHTTGVKPLTEDHKPNRDDERKRIIMHGGTVVWKGVWRVDGILAVSRAIGDRLLKIDDHITAKPDVVHWKITSSARYLVIATDGLWDVMTGDDVRHAINDVPTWGTVPAPQDIADYLVRSALKRGTKDNVTAVVVELSSPTKGGTSKPKIGRKTYTSTEPVARR